MSFEIPISQTPTILWDGKKVSILDQTLLPLEESYIVTDDYKVVCDAIKCLSIRGAPAIGVAGAYACALAANSIEDKSVVAFLEKFRSIAKEISETRPTAVNLGWAVGKMLECIAISSDNVEDIKIKLIEQARLIMEDDLLRCHKLCMIGSKLILDKSEIMTICNTGGLVGGGGIGSALSIIQYAHSQGKDLKVHVCETRPLLQGLRLNTWELKRTKTPFTLLTDNMAAQAMKNSNISLVIVGADRIAANGDTANKIGTYSLAVLAKYHKIPFYVAAPLSTVDYSIISGEQIPVENRDPKEVTRIKGIKLTFEDIDVSTPAFDVTPFDLIEGIITEKGVVRQPYLESLALQRKGNL